MSGKAKIILTFGISVIMFMSIGIYSWFNTNRYKDDSKWVTHTYEVISKAQNVSSYLQEMGSSYRSYALSGNDIYLTPFYESGINTDKEIQVLKALTRDNKPQQILLDSIKIGR